MVANTLSKGLNIISTDVGLLHHIFKLPILNGDPLMHNYGVWPSNTKYLSFEKFSGRSSGCGYEWKDAILGTIGETVERYAAAFYNLSETVFSSFKKLNKRAVHPDQYALFHEKQFDDKRFKIVPFNIDVELNWFPTIDLTNGAETWIPGQFIYLPFTIDKYFITSNTSTGLAAHTNFYSAILNGLYECIERDSFVITWMQNLVSEKIIINGDIQNYLSQYFPTSYSWHFFDITYDIEVPTILGFCFGEAEYGRFVAVGSAARATYGLALKKVIQEIGQAVPYFRYLLGVKKDWCPSDDFTLIQNFEEHSIFYLKRPDLWYIFDKWINKNETKHINFHAISDLTEQEEIKHIVKILKNKNYNVLFKDLTTPDIRQVGFYAVKLFIPQLIQLAGAYPLYFLGGERLYSVPKLMGFNVNDFSSLNKFPHPFP